MSAETCGTHAACASAYSAWKAANQARLAMLDKINSIRGDAGDLRGVRGKAYSAAAALISRDVEARRAPLRQELEVLTENVRVASERLAQAKRDAGLI